jgi:hypothetical protein
MKTTTRPLKHSMNRSSWPLALLTPLALLCFALLLEARAACQDACLTNSNTVQGDDALISNVGFGNTAIGWQALLFNTTGGFNTATGGLALSGNTSGILNTATGYAALAYNTTGGSNTATGEGALAYNSAGGYNTACGVATLYNNDTGSSNTATGITAMYSNTSGSNNTATGSQALGSNTTGSNNTATGSQALYYDSAGNYNTANGQAALYSNTTGRNNTAIGQNAMRSNTTGSFNVALGENAGIQLTTGSNNIEIGHRGASGEANTIRIGRQGTQTATYVAGISGATISTGVPVIVDIGGHLGTTTSSARFKEAIKPMDKASEAILALKPVTFRYKHVLDPDGVAQFGLVAEQVEKVNPDLVARDEEGKPYTVRYEAVNAMLLNEFLKEHREVQELKKQLAALTVGLQKVSAQLEASKPAPQTVSNP